MQPGCTDQIAELLLNRGGDEVLGIGLQHGAGGELMTIRHYSAHQHGGALSMLPCSLSAVGGLPAVVFGDVLPAQVRVRELLHRKLALLRAGRQLQGIAGNSGWRGRDQLEGFHFVSRDGFFEVLHDRGLVDQRWR
jgi:hypothetical protein